MSKKKYEYERVTFYHEGKQYVAYGKTPKEAHAKAAKKQLALEAGQLRTGGNMPVKQWAYEWLETYKEPSVGYGQYQNYTAFIDGVIIPAIGNKRLKDVKDIDLQKILNSRAGKSKSNLSKLRGLLKAMFRRARISKLIPYDPAEDLTLPAATDGTHRSLTPFEKKSILAFAECHHAGLWIKIMLYCGIRPGETRALDWRHIDFAKKRIRVEQAMKAATSEIGAPKSASGVRSIPIPDALLPSLLAAKGSPFEPVLTQPTTGKRHTKSSMRCLWENFKREWDISLGAKLYRNQIIISRLADDLTAYCLRHTYGTDLQDAGVPINVAKSLMGHSDISMTANIYTHITEQALDDVADKLNAQSKVK